MEANEKKEIAKQIRDGLKELPTQCTLTAHVAWMNRIADELDPPKRVRERGWYQSDNSGVVYWDGSFWRDVSGLKWDGVTPENPPLATRLNFADHIRRFNGAGLLIMDFVGSRIQAEADAERAQ